MKLILTGLMTILILGTMNSVFAMEQTSGASHSSQVEVQLPNGLTGIASPLYTTQGPSAGYVVPAGGTLDGVADLLLTFSTGTFRCTGSLLQSDPLGGDNDMAILTAAHCVDINLDGTVDLLSATAKFERPAGDETIAVDVAQTMVHPGWDGDYIEGDDLAILVLVSPPSPDVNRYTWDTNPANDIGGDADQVGYGRSGMMSTGDILASGTKRAILNDRDGTTDVIAAAFGGVTITPGYGIVLDGDNGLAANDACAVLSVFFPGICVAGLGNGLAEGLSAGGDSGGPSFNGVPNGASPDEVQLVTSWGGTFFFPGQSDVNAMLDSSHGEFSVHTRTSIYASWIEATLLMKNKLEPGPQIGGELLPIDTTALFVSGLYGSAMWLAPIGAGIAGVGYYLVQRLYK